MSVHPFKSATLAAAITAGLALPMDAEALQWAYVKLDTIEGEATDPGHKDWIPILSWSWEIDDDCEYVVKMEKEVDIATPKLMQAVQLGTTIPRVEIDILRMDDRSGALVPYTYHNIKNAQVKSVSSAIDSAGGTENFELRFSETQLEVTAANGEGSVTETLLAPGCKGGGK